MEFVLLDLLPGRDRLPEIKFLVSLRIGVEQATQDGIRLRLVALHDHAEHLAVDVVSSVIRRGETLKLLEPLLVVEELAALVEVLTQERAF